MLYLLLLLLFAFDINQVISIPKFLQYLTNLKLIWII